MLLTRRRFIVSASATGMLSACAGFPNKQAPMQTVPLESLVRQMKHDIGSYIYEHQNDPLFQPTGRPCGGQADFAIQKVKMTVTATLDRTFSANAGLQVPINLVTLEASGSRARTIGNTVTLNLEIWPITAGEDAEFEDETAAAQRLTAIPPPSPDFSGTPIRDALNQLRRDLIATADTPPCFNFGEGEQKGNVVKWGFSLTNKAQSGGKLSLLIFSVGAESSATHTFANSIEATFIATGVGFG
jgi:hypothetical protein